MSDWKENKLGDVLEIKYGKDHKTLGDGQIPAYGSGGIMRYVDRAIYEDKSILIPRKGSLNNIFYKEEPFWTVDTMFWTKINEERVYPKFLFYQLTTVDYTNLNVGSAVPSLTVPVIEAIDILLPPMKEQKAIANVLSALDDKIDLLYRQNKTLEYLAETLFRQWFVEEAEESWEVGVLDDIASFYNGKSRPNEIGNTPIYGGNGILGYTNQFNYSGKSIIVGRVGAYCGSLYFENNEIWVSDNALLVKAKRDNQIHYLYYLLKSLELNSMAQGSSHPLLTQTLLKSIEIVKHPYSKIEGFCSQVAQWNNKIEFNNKQIRTLMQTRDTLLPKLMSGEVRVKI